MPALSDLPPGTPVIAGVLGLILLLLLFALRGRGARKAYRRAGPLFTAAEKRFLDALERAVEGRARVYGKVRLADLLAVRDTVTGKHWFRAFNAIACKHADYVLCSLDTLEPLLVIELDDSSHARADRRQRDAFVDEALTGAGIPVLHVPVQSRYALRDVQEALRDFLPPR